MKKIEAIKYTPGTDSYGKLQVDEKCIAEFRNKENYELYANLFATLLRIKDGQGIPWEDVCEFVCAVCSNIRNAEKLIEILGESSGCFGIESVSCGDKQMEYINTGDTYSTTIVEEPIGVLSVGTWGGWYEDAEKEFCEDNKVIRCSNCGKFTDLTLGANWSDVICSHCQSRVGG